MPVSLYTKCVDSCQAFSQYFMYTSLFEKGGTAFFDPGPGLEDVRNIIYTPDQSHAPPFWGGPWGAGLTHVGDRA